MNLPEVLDAIGELEPSDISAVLAACAARLASRPEQAPAAAGAEPDELVDVNEAAKRLGVSCGWLYHRRDLPFRVKVGGKALFSSAGIVKYLRTHQGR